MNNNGKPATQNNDWSSPGSTGTEETPPAELLEEKADAKDSQGKEQESGLGGTAIFALAILVIIAFVIGLVRYWQNQQPDERTPMTESSYSLPTVELDTGVSIEDIPDDLIIGVVVSYTEEVSEGLGWDKNGEGVSVARWRLEKSGMEITLGVVSDNGTEEGARSAVSQLAEDGAGAIIALTTGDHTRALAEAVAESGIPVIFPYEPRFETEADAWFYNLSPEEMAGMMIEQAETLGCSSSLLISDDELFSAYVTLAIDSGSDFRIATSYVITADNERSERGTEKIVEYLVEYYQTNQEYLECVMLDASGTDVATLITGMRSSGIDVPIITTNEAQNYTLNEAMLNSYSLLGEVYSVGVADNVSLAAESSQIGDKAGVFNYAITLMKGKTGVASLSTDADFSEYGDYADLASHDALIAVVQAAANAQDASPEAITAAFYELELDPETSPVSEKLDFSSTEQSVRASYIVQAAVTGEVSSSGGYTQRITWSAVSQD